MKDVINIVIVILLLVILLQMCNKKPSAAPGDIVIHRDTTWIIKDSTIHSKPQLVTHQVETDSLIIKEFYPDTSYKGLLAQYNKLLDDYLAKNNYSDSLKIDSIGYVHIKDSIMKNTLVGRTYRYNLTYPIVHDSVIKYADPRREFYFGGGIQGFRGGVIRTFNTGLMYKDKKERVYILSGTIDNNNNLGVQLQTYWKLY